MKYVVEISADEADVKNQYELAEILRYLAQQVESNGPGGVIRNKKGKMVGFHEVTRGTID